MTLRETDIEPYHPTDKPRRMRWIDIVSAALLDGGHTQMVFPADGFVLFEYGFWLATYSDHIRIFFELPRYSSETLTETEWMNRYVETLGKRDVAAFAVEGTPAQGAYVHVPKMYNDDGYPQRYHFMYQVEPQP